MPDYRTPAYLSPSALSTWEEAPDEAFTRYVVPKDIRPERQLQTSPMSVGSAFDALVKNALYKRYFGEDACLADSYRIRDLVVQQCQEHTLPESLVIAIDCFDQYVECGALEILAELIDRSKVLPRMEFDLTAVVEGVPLLGKPDLHFHTRRGAHVITDWKVSGSVSKGGVSPQQGYKSCRTIAGGKDNVPHKKFVACDVGGVIVNSVPMNETTDYWADQLATYAWALGEPIGSQDFICRIEQLACRPTPKKDTTLRLKIKCVVHQSTVAANYQRELIERYKRAWSGIQSGHYFQDVSRAASDARANLICKRLENPGYVEPSPLVPKPDGLAPVIDWGI